MKKIVISLFLSAAIWGCSDSDTPSLKPHNDIPVTKELAMSRAEEAVNANDPKRAIEGLHSFNKESKLQENIIFSPLSFNMAMGMTASATSGALQNSIVDWLGAQDIASCQNYLNKLIRYYANPDVTGVDVYIANSCWLANSCNPSPTYESALADFFYAPVYKVDFSSQSALDLINGWVKEKTDGQIAEMFRQLSPRTQFIQLNTFTFDGKWALPFDSNQTRLASFHGLKGVTDVNMMNQEATFEYFASESFQAVTLPFNKNLTKMLLILPSEDNDVNSLISQLHQDGIKNILERLERTPLELRVPKFDLEDQLHLKELIDFIGKDVSGNFSDLGCADDIDLSGLQKVKFSIDESGAKIKAATSSHGELTDGYYPKMELVFDRPFVVVIYNQLHGNVMLIGKIANIQ